MSKIKSKGFGVLLSRGDICVGYFSAVFKYLEFKPVSLKQSSF